ncbi:excinuclease ABC subunit A, partial [Vagococcus fluvialis]|nr:excinuclease ABC subunit A [Vagococcus fluvialis]
MLSKLALDNEAKKNKDMIATWRYEDVPNTVWQIKNMTDFWGINTRTEKTLNNKGIYSIKELANYDYFSLKASMGIMGEQLYAHSWGIDRTKLSDVYVPKSKSIGNSQVLMKDYTDVSEIKIVIREIAEQVATRIRSSGKQTSCVRLTIGYSRFDSERGFNRQITIQPTNQSRELTAHCMRLFDKFYNPKMAVRNIAVSYAKLTDDT